MDYDCEWFTVNWIDTNKEKTKITNFKQRGERLNKITFKQKLNLIGRIESYLGYFIGFTFLTFGAILFRLDGVFIGSILMLICYFVNRSLQKESCKK